MLWRCFSWHRVGNLAPIHGIMAADKYVDILTENLEESTLKMDLDEEWMLQDNDPKHTAKKTKKFLQDCETEVLEWPPQSVDLNPIKNCGVY